MKHSLPAEALRRAMVARGWSIKDLASAAGVDRGTIRNALNGEVLTLATEGRILAAIGEKPPSPAIVEAQRELAS